MNFGHDFISRVNEKSQYLPYVHISKLSIKDEEYQVKNVLNYYKNFFFPKIDS